MIFWKIFMIFADFPRVTAEILPGLPRCRVSGRCGHRPLQGQCTYGNTVGDDDHIVPKRLLLEEKPFGGTKAPPYTDPYASVTASRSRARIVFTSFSTKPHTGGSSHLS